jgi:hypothetical protein
VTLDQVKARLRITSTADDVDVQAMADQAEAHIVGWCSRHPLDKANADAWIAEPTTVPDVIVVSILLQAGELYRFRGDEVDGPPRQAGEELSVQIRELLRAYHTPVVA